MRCSVHAIRYGGLALALTIACGQQAPSNEDNDGEEGGTSAVTGGNGGSLGGSSPETGGNGGSFGGSTSETGGNGGSLGGSSTGGSATGGTNAGTGTGGSGANAGSGAGGTGGAGTGGGGAGGQAAALPPMCQQACSTAADCATDVAWNDLDNHACVNGACVYTGCNNLDECTSLAPTYVCQAYPGNPIKGCIPGCSVSADCSLGIPAYDADNYTCDNGGCIYRGCNNDMECDALIAGRVCRRDASGYGSCWEPCLSASDCILNGAAYDEDNFTCTGGLCTYVGCHSDAECNGTGPAVYVCR
ncbi:MAG TPA: hypothetical protein VF103_17745 [Polyangiaceae bacterium]